MEKFDSLHKFVYYCNWQFAHSNKNCNTIHSSYLLNCILESDLCYTLLLYVTDARTASLSDNSDAGLIIESTLTDPLSLSLLIMPLLVYHITTAHIPGYREQPDAFFFFFPSLLQLVESRLYGSLFGSLMISAIAPVGWLSGM